MDYEKCIRIHSKFKNIGKCSPLENSLHIKANFSDFRFKVKCELYLSHFPDIVQVRDSHSRSCL